MFDKLNKKYYDFLDFMESKGIPLKKYNAFLENHGIPGLWFNLFLFIFIVVIIIIGINYLLNPNILLTVNLQDDSGLILEGPFSIVIYNGDNVVYDGLISNGETITLNGVIVGSNLDVKLNSDNYELVTNNSFILEKRDYSVTLILSKKQLLGVAKLKLIDNETKTIVANASVELYDAAGNLIDTFKSDSLGLVEFNDIPLNENLTLKIKKDGYSEVEKEVIFSDNGEEEIYLEPYSLNNNDFATISFIVSGIYPVADANVKIYDAESNKLLDEGKTDSDGKISFDIKLGTKVRYIINHNDFMSYDSNYENTNFTVRGNDTINVTLKLGGSSLTVNVNTNNVSLKEAKVYLISEDGLVLTSKVTDNYGQCSFEGLNLKIAKYVLVEKENFYPETKKINNDTLSFDLNPIDLTSVVKVNLFIVDVDNKPFANAKIDVFDSNLPIYVNKNSNLNGFLELYLKPGTYKIRAYSKGFKTIDEINVTKTNNKFTLVLLPAGGFVKLKVYDYLNNPLKNAKVFIYDNLNNPIKIGNLDKNGSFSFITDKKEVKIDVVYNNKTYSFVENTRDVILLQISPNDGKELDIKFKGIYVNNVKVTTLKPGNDYFLKFDVFLPEDYGSAKIYFKLPDALNVGLISAKMKGVLKYNYYFNNKKTTSGKMNDKIEILTDNIVSNKTITLKVRVLKDTDLDKINLNYGLIFKSLKDNKEQTVNKDINLNILSGQGICNDEFCVSYNLYDGISSYDHYIALIDSFYAFDVFVDAKKSIDVTIKLSSDQKIILNNYQIDAKDFNPKDEKHLDLYVRNLHITNKKLIRFYFKPKLLGVGKLSLDIKTKNNSIHKDISVKIVPKKGFLVDFKPIIKEGESLILKMRDSDKTINNAFIKILDEKNNVIFTIKGNDSKDNGLDGIYKIDNLPTGEYKLHISALGYMDKIISFIVTKIGILDVPNEIELKIPKGSKAIKDSLDIKNNSEFSIQKLSYRIIRNSADDFKLSFRFLTPYVNAKKTTKLFIESKVNDLNPKFGDLELLIKGVLNTGEVTFAIVHVVLKSQEDYDASCLKVNPSALKVSLPDFINAKTQLSIMFENNCKFNLDIKPEFVVRDGSEPTVVFRAHNFKLAKGQKYTAEVEFKNITKKPADGEIKDYFINIKTPYFVKQIPVTIDVWKAISALSLQFPPVVYVSTSQPVEMPLMLTNNGTIPVENISFFATQNANNLLLSPRMEETANYSLQQFIDRPVIDNYDERYLEKLGREPFVNNYSNEINEDGYFIGLNDFLPYNYGKFMVYFKPRTIPKLNPGESVIIGTVVKAYSDVKSYSSNYAIGANGFINNGKIKVRNSVITTFVNSAKSCFKILNYTNAEPIVLRNFVSEKESTIRLKVANYCAEPIQILPLDRKQILGLPIYLENPLVLAPGQQSNIYLKVKPIKEVESTIPLNIYIKYLNSSKFTSVPVMIQFSIGSANDNLSGSDPIISKEITNCDTGEKTTITIPRVGFDHCNSNYCDGKSASDYLLKIVKDYLNKFKSKSLALIRNRSITACEDSYCQFSDLGIGSKTITLYLTNDYVDPLYITKQLKKENIAILGVSESNIDLEKAGDLRFANTKKLYLPKLDKCGKYILRLEGVVLRYDNSLQMDSYNLVLSLVDYAKTAECELKTNNIPVFIPKDKDIANDSAFAFYKTQINYLNSEFKLFAEKLSKKLFNVVRIGNTSKNIIFLKKGDAKPIAFNIKENKNQIVTEIIIDKKMPLDDPKIIDSLINLIENYLLGEFIGCNTKTGEINVNSVTKGKGKVALKGCDSITVYNGMNSCNLEIIGTYAYSDLHLEVVNPYVTATIYYDGVEYNNNPIKLTFDPKKKAYIAKLAINFKFDNVEDLVNYKDSEPITLKLTSDNSGVSQSKDIKINVCGITPKEFLTTVIKKDEGTYSSILKWDGKEIIPVCDVIKDIIKNNKDKGVYLTASKCGVIDSKGYYNILYDKYTDWTTYTSAAAAGVVTCGVSKALIGRFFNPVTLVGSALECLTYLAGNMFVHWYLGHRFAMRAGLSTQNIIDEFFKFTKKLTKDVPVLGSVIEFLLPEMPELSGGTLDEMLSSGAKGATYGAGLKATTRLISNTTKSNAINKIKALALAAKTGAGDKEKLLEEAYIVAEEGGVPSSVVEDAFNNKVALESSALNREIIDNAGKSLDSAKWQITNYKELEKIINNLPDNGYIELVKSDKGAYLEIKREFTIGGKTISRTKYLDLADGFFKFKDESKDISRRFKRILKTLEDNGRVKLTKNSPELRSLLRNYKIYSTKVLRNIANNADDYTKAILGDAFDKLSLGDLSDDTLKLLESRTKFFNKQVKGLQYTPIKTKVKKLTTEKLKVGSVTKFLGNMLEGAIIGGATSAAYWGVVNVKINHFDEINNLKIINFLNNVDYFEKYNSYVSTYTKTGKSKYNVIISKGLSGEDLAECKINAISSVKVKEKVNLKNVKDSTLLENIKSVYPDMYARIYPEWNLIDDYYKKYVKSDLDKAFILAIITQESRYKQSHYSGGHGVMQMTTAGCKAVGFTTRSAIQACLYDHKTNLKAGILLIDKYYKDIKNYLSNVFKINDKIIAYYFTALAYNRGVRTAKLAMYYAYMKNYDITAAIEKAQKDVFGPGNTKTIRIGNNFASSVMRHFYNIIGDSTAFKYVPSRVAKAKSNASNQTT